MERHGFIHDIMDVKVLILYVMNRVIYPVDAQKIYELCLQDDCLSYFDVLQAIPQMVDSGHLAQTEEGYVITEKGKEDAALTEDSVAFPVAQRAARAVERFNREVRRSALVRTEILEQSNGDYLAVMSLDDELGRLMTLELTATSSRQAMALNKAFEAKADKIFQLVIGQLTAREPAPETAAPDGGSGK